MLGPELPKLERAGSNPVHRFGPALGESFAPRGRRAGVSCLSLRRRGLLLPPPRRSSRSACLGLSRVPLPRLGLFGAPGAAMISVELVEERSIPEPNTGCWIWLGSVNVVTGYGRSFRDGRYVSAHRLAWMAANGREIPPGLVVLHSCDNPPCVNPAHLSVGTQGENNADRDRKGRVCREKHRAATPKGEAHAHHKLTEAQVLEIRRRGEEGEGAYSIAPDFGVTRRAVDYILSGKTWRHLRPLASFKGKVKDLKLANLSVAS